MSKDTKTYSREELLEIKDKLILSNGTVNKQLLTIDYMDNYAAKLGTEKEKESYIGKVVAIPMEDILSAADRTPQKKSDGTTKQRVNKKAVMNAFLEVFFPEYTDEAIEKKKEEKRLAKEAAKKAKEEEKNLTPEEIFRRKMEKLGKE